MLRIMAPSSNGLGQDVTLTTQGCIEIVERTLAGSRIIRDVSVDGTFDAVTSLAMDRLMAGRPRGGGARGSAEHWSRLPTCDLPELVRQAIEARRADGTLKDLQLPSPGRTVAVVLGGAAVVALIGFGLARRRRAA